MTPDQIKLAVQLAIAAAVLVAAAAGGWVVNGYRLAGEISRLEGIVATQKQSIATLAGANDRCTAGLADVKASVKGYVDAATARSEAAQAAMEAAAARSQGHLDAAKAALSRAAPQAGQECPAAAAEASAYARKRKGTL